MMKLSEKIRTLLSTWMARYAQPLVEECAHEASKLEEENEALKNFLRQVKAMMRERYQPHVIERQIDALLTDLKEVAQSTKEISAIPEDTQVSDVPASP